MNIVNKVFRYKQVSVCFMIGILILMITLMGGITIVNDALNKEADRQYAQYKNKVVIDFNMYGEYDELFDLLKNVKTGNIKLSGKLGAYYNAVGGTYIGDVLIVCNEEANYKLLRGCLPGQAGNTHERQVAVGTGKLDMIYEADGVEYIDINGEAYVVTGIIGSESSDYWISKVVFVWDYIGDELKKSIARNGVGTLYYESDTEDVGKHYGELYKLAANELGSRLVMSGQIVGDGESIVSENIGKNHIEINGVIYLFCIIDCIIISNLWFATRKREFAIRKVCGMSNMQILRVLVSDIVKMILIVAIGFVALGVLAKPIITGTLGIKFAMTPVTCIGIVGSVFIVILFSVSLPMYKLLRMRYLDVK